MQKLMILIFMLTAIFITGCMEKPEDLYQKGLTAKNSGKIEEAISFFKKTITAKKDFIKAYTELAEIYSDNKKYNEAEDILNSAIEIAPKNMELKRIAGMNYIKCKSYSKAITVLKSIEKKDAKTSYSLGLAYKNNNMYTPALKCFEEAIKIDKEYAEAYAEIGSIYRKKQQTQKAKDMLSRANRLNSEIFTVQYELGNIYYSYATPSDPKTYKTAINFYEKAIAIDKKSDAALNAMNNLGSAYFANGDKDTAVKYWEEVLTIDPSHKGATRNIERYR